MLAQGPRDRQHHAFRSADKGRCHRADVDPLLEQRGTFVGIDTAGEKVDLLCLAAKNVQDRKPAEIGVLQVVQLFAEHDRADLAVGIDEREARLRFACQNSFDNGEQGRDAAAGGKAEVVFRDIGFERGEEMPHRRHGFERIAHLQAFVRPSREMAAIDAFDADFYDAIVLAGADRIGTTQLLVVKTAAERQILALRKVEQGAVRLGGRERHDNGVAGFPADVRHGQRMETGHGLFPYWWCISA